VASSGAGSKISKSVLLAVLANSGLFSASAIRTQRDVKNNFLMRLANLVSVLLTNVVVNFTIGVCEKFCAGALCCILMTKINLIVV
jgi:hypothetical protein